MFEISQTNPSSNESQPNPNPNESQPNPNPNGVPSYSPGLPESARATLGLFMIENTTLKGLHKPPAIKTTRQPACPPPFPISQTMTQRTQRTTEFGEAAKPPRAPTQTPLFFPRHFYPQITQINTDANPPKGFYLCSSVSSVDKNKNLPLPEPTQSAGRASQTSVSREARSVSSVSLV